MVREQLVTTFGLGRMRPAPGTWGSMPPAALALAMLWEGASYEAYHWVLALVAVVSGGACIVFGVWTEHRFRRKDPSECVADETCAQCLPLMFWPREWFESCQCTGGACGAGCWRAVLSVGVCFVLFRVLDIIKPWPGRRLERWPYGWGVLADDISSGLYALFAAQVATRLLA